VTRKQEKKKKKKIKFGGLFWTTNHQVLAKFSHQKTIIQSGVFFFFFGFPDCFILYFWGEFSNN
jgi:hypothetical protein